MRFGFIFCLFILIFFSTSAQEDSRDLDLLKQSWGLKLLDVSSGDSLSTSFVDLNSFDVSGNWSFSFEFNIHEVNEYGEVFRFTDKLKSFTFSANYLHFLNPDTSYFYFYVNSIKRDIIISLPKNNIPPDKWYSMEVIYTNSQNNLVVKLNNKKEGEALLVLPNNLNINLTFASINDFLGFSIRNVRWYNNQQLAHWWKFSDGGGDIVTDFINNKNGRQFNGAWLQNKNGIFNIEWVHQIEKPELHPKGFFDNNSDIFYFATFSNIVTYNIHTKKESVIVSKNKRPSRQVNTVWYKNALAIFHDGAEGEVSFFDKQTKRWSYINEEKDFEQRFYGSGLIVDNDVLYSLFGYGWYKWKNIVRTYNPTTKIWDTLKTKPNKDLYYREIKIILPGIEKNEWYFSGLFSTTSITGSQEDDPIRASKQKSDFWSFSTKTNSFKKIGELQESLSLKYSLKTFFRKDSMFFLFGESKIEKQPVLLMTKIGSSNYTAYSYKLPAVFGGDIESRDFTMSFYNSKTNKVYLVLRDNGKLYIASSPFPPIYIEPNINNNASILTWNKLNIFYFVLMGFGFIGVGYIYWNKFKKKQKVSDKQTFFPIPKVVPTQRALFLFGSLSILNNEGEDVSKKLTEQSEQIFLLILLHTISDGGRIAGATLDELLYDVNSTPSTANKRTVAISRLRKSLKLYPEIEIITDETTFSIKLNELSLIDLYRIQYYVDLENDEILSNRDLLNDFCLILERGPFLSRVDYSSLDSFKNKINESIQNKLLLILEEIQNNKVKQTSENQLLNNRIATILLIHDPINEPGMIIRVNWLKQNGSFGLAEKVYRTFANNYKETYDESYKLTFNAIINENKNGD